MALERPLNGELIPNPQEFSSENREECANYQRKAANMQKFKEVVIKLAGSAPNKPLSEIQKNAVGAWLNDFLSVLRTPDHPPYSVMIKRAIRELNKDGGSSEESISNFIRKEYDDLPWSHFTLLKHHLGALCDCGSIILTNSQHYLLAGTDVTLPFGKNCKRRESRMKQDLEREIKRQKLVKGDNGVESVLQKGLEQQQCLEDAKQIDEGDDLTELENLERPPGFGTVTFKGTSNLPVSCTKNPPSQECGISIRNHELLEVKSEAASRSEQGAIKLLIRNPAVKPSSCQEPYPPQEIIEKSDSSSPTASSLLYLQSQEHAISDTSKLQKVKSLTDKGSEHKVHSVQAAQSSCTEEHHPSVCPKLHMQFQSLKFSGLGASSVEKSPPTSCLQGRQRNHWYKQLLNLKESQLEQHQTPLKSSRLTMKQAILGMKVKKNGGQKNVPLPSLSDQQEFNKLSSSQMHPKHPPEKRVSQKPSCGIIRPWLLISPSHSHHELQQQQRGKPESGIITNDKVVSFPNPHPGEQLFDKSHGSPGEERKLASAGTPQHTHWHGRSQKKQEGKSRCLLWQEREKLSIC